MEVHSPRESLLSEAWERKRGQNCRSKSMNMEAQISACTRSFSLSTGLASSSSSHTSTSLTDDDFEELKGCIQLGFSFRESSIPELTHILPALHACYAVTHNFNHDTSPPHSPFSSSSSSWKVTNPGDDADEVKERLKHWAQAVACNLRSGN